jgi:hypothetical protein
MTNSPIAPKRVLLLGSVLFVVGIGAGVWAYTTNSGAGIMAWMRPTMGLLFMLVGILSLYQFGVFRPKDDLQRKVRTRMLMLGTVQLALGAGQLIPNQTIRLTATGLAVLAMFFLTLKFPKRLFA